MILIYVIESCCEFLGSVIYRRNQTHKVAIDQFSKTNNFKKFRTDGRLHFSKISEISSDKRGKLRTVRVYGGNAEVSCNESIYLRVVGFRESMHDDATSHPPNTKTHPSFSNVARFVE